MTEIIAEISGNHGGNLDNALLLIQEAKAAGADAVKFQCFSPIHLASKRAGIVWGNKRRNFLDLVTLYGAAYTPRGWFPTLIRTARNASLPWFSSVFDPDDVAFLETLDCPRYKISAYEMLDGNLINAVVRTGKPIIMSVRPRDGLTVMLATGYGREDDIQHGLSDHTPWGRLPVPGCSMVERHLRLPGVDTADKEFSSTPEEFRDYVAAIRKQQ
jgi:sialic acid synthase SpsE